jgi:hypothetical protein
VAEVINLRLARKAKSRAEKTRQAEANRAKFGQAKAERNVRQAEAERAARELDGKKRDS